MAYLLQKKRKEKGLTQEDIAEIVGICPLSVFRYENYRRKPDLLTAYRIAKTLGDENILIEWAEELERRDRMKKYW